MPGRLYAKHGEAASAEWQQYQLEELQGEYLMIVLQYWTGNPTARTRVRQQRFPKVVHVCLNPDQNITGLTIADFPSSGCTHNATLSGPSDKRSDFFSNVDTERIIHQVYYADLCTL